MPSLAGDFICIKISKSYLSYIFLKAITGIFGSPYFQVQYNFFLHSYHMYNNYYTWTKSKHFWETLAIQFCLQVTEFLNVCQTVIWTETYTQVQSWGKTNSILWCDRSPRDAFECFLQLIDSFGENRFSLTVVFSVAVCQYPTYFEYSTFLVAQDSAMWTSSVRIFSEQFPEVNVLTTESYQNRMVIWVKRSTDHQIIRGLKRKKAHVELTNNQSLFSLWMILFTMFLSMWNWD